MFVFDYSEDLDIATYEYRIYQANQVEADTAHSGYYKLINAATIDSGTIAPYSQGFNLSNVFTVAVENSTTTSSSTTTSPISYYGAIRPIDTSANLGPWTLITKTSTDTPLIDQQFIGSLTAAKITTGTLGAAEITLNGANSIIKSSNYSAGSLGWKITGLGDAEFNDLTVRTALDIGGSDASSFHVDVNGNLWLGASTYATAPFKVSNSGNVDVGSTTVGDASSFHIDNAGNIWAGAGTFNTSTNPFSVTSAGALKATGANISGAITATSGTFNGRLQAGDIYIPNTTSPVFSVTTGGAVTASSVTITGGTVGGVNTSSDKLYLGTGTYSNNNTPFFVGLHSGVNKFSLGTGLTWDGSTLTITGAINATSGTFNGTINAAGGTINGYLTSGSVDIGYLRPFVYSYFKGINLSADNATQFTNVFMRGIGNEVYFRVDNGSQWMKFENGTVQIKAVGFEVDGSSAIFSGSVSTGALTATGGTIGGWLITDNLLQGQATTLNATRIQLLKSVPANPTYYGNTSYHNLPAMCLFDNLNTKAIGYFGSYSDNIVSMEGITGSTYIEIDSDGADSITIHADTTSLSGAAGIHLNSGNQNVWFDSYTHTSATSQYLRILQDGRAILGAPSDISLKQNINTAPSVIEKVKQLNIVNFYWKDKYNYGSAEQIGLIAQELEQIFPSFVGLDHSTNKKNISTDPLLFVCIKAIQELCDKIDLLELKLENG